MYWTGIPLQESEVTVLSREPEAERQPRQCIANMPFHVALNTKVPGDALRSIRAVVREFSDRTLRELARDQVQGDFF